MNLITEQKSQQIINGGYIDDVCSLQSIGLPKPEKIILTKEEKLKRVEDFIEKYNIESDDKAVYLYKKVNLDGTNIWSSNNKITYEIGKVYTEKVDEDINKDCSFGLHASTLDYALSFNYMFTNNMLIMPSLSGGYWNSNNYNIQNPFILKEKPNYKIYKVKIYKEHIIVPSSNDGKIRCSQMEILEEIELKDAIEYKNISITEVNDIKYSGWFEYTFEVSNKYTNKSITVKFKSNSLDLAQEEIKRFINERIDTMQKLYDLHKESNGIL